MLSKWIKDIKYWKVVLLVGVFSLAFGLIAYKTISSDTRNIAMLKGMLTGFGASLVGVASIKLLQHRFSPAEKLKAKEIWGKDERNIQILRMAYSISNTVAIILFAVMIFLFIAMDYILPAFISLGALYIQLISFFIANKHYHKKM